MSVKPLLLRKTGLALVDEALEAVRTKIQEILGTPGVQAEVARQFTVASGTTTVGHGLGRRPVGWYVVGKSGNVNLWDAKDPDTRHLYVGSNGTAKVTVVVF